MSTIFAGLNTLKRLEIRLAGGPFVHGVPCRPGMKDCNVLSRKRDGNRVQLSEPSSRTVFRDSPRTLENINTFFSFFFFFDFKISFSISSKREKEFYHLYHVKRRSFGAISARGSYIHKILTSIGWKWERRNFPFRGLVFRRG